MCWALFFTQSEVEMGRQLNISYQGQKYIVEIAKVNRFDQLRDENSNRL
jgi:hypothetical protein